MEIVMKRTEKYFERKADQVLNALFGKSNLILLSGDTVLSGHVVSELKSKADYDRKIKTPKQNEKTIYNHKLEMFNEYDIDNPMYLTYGALAVVFIERFDVVYQHGDVNIAIDALKDKDIKVVLTSNKSRKEVAHLLKNRTMKTIEVNYLENKASKRTAANKEAIEAFDTVETFPDEIPFPEVDNDDVLSEQAINDMLNMYTEKNNTETDDLLNEISYLKSQLKEEEEISNCGRKLLEEADEFIQGLIAENKKLKEEVKEHSIDLFRLEMINDLNESDSTMYKKEYNQLKDEKEALTLRIEILEEEKNKADEDYDYIVLENMTLQSEIIGLERKIEELKKEHDEKINSLYGELEYIIKKKK
ncbi:hypothetical protein D7H20_22045 [Salmonella enterica]|nr:hypothetical protein [Salmonella enterica subsp. enterica serovar Kentucky]EKB1060680.1 hypothetical protein [Salmonella enterica subsp. enterica serovar Infantis]EKJ3704654.1 hypothetical protein [Salmonella enterica subsp. enterica serovar Infantis]ELT2524843.1 hypothetical protein [Salmonella enterica subsp. enterica serovar Schwarzengrund]